MLMTNFIGKPYAGKPHVRFNEGVGTVIYPSRSTLPVKKTFSTALLGFIKKLIIESPPFYFFFSTTFVAVKLTLPSGVSAVPVIFVPATFPSTVIE